MMSFPKEPRGVGGLLEGHQETGGHIYYVSSDNSMFHFQHSNTASYD